MRRLILTAVSAAILAAAVSAMESLPGKGLALPAPRTAVETAEQGSLALEAIENLIPAPGAAPAQITFAVVSDLETPQDGADPLEDMTAWQLQILDSSGKKVSFIQDSGQPPPPMISWTGTAKNGAPLPGGFYAAKLVWMDKAKKVRMTRSVPFNLFSPLKTPEFAELKLDFRFAGGFPDL